MSATTHPIATTMKVFVVMPFSHEFRDTYELGVKAACNNCGIECDRVDEPIFGETILERIYNQISQADLILAVMTGRNPNVYYEVGYAHGLNKRVVPLIHDANDIPFDLRNYPHIVYGDSIADLKQKLQTIIKHYVAHPAELHPQLSHSGVDDARIVQHITNYLRANGFTKMSFASIRERIGSDYTDPLLLGLIDRRPDVFRRVRLAGGKPGVGFV
jgi:hypothetical protein